VQYADEQVLFANYDNELQYQVHHLNHMANISNIEISTTEKKNFGLRGKTQVQLHRKLILEQGNSFKCLGYTLFYSERMKIQIIVDQ
jgi:hypothetical protein